jgi:O-antigen ligase
LKTADALQEGSSRLDRFFVTGLIVSIPTIPFGRFGVGGFEIPLAVLIIAVYACLKSLTLMRDARPEAFRPYITMVLAFFITWSAASLLWVREYDLALSSLVTRSFQIFSCIIVINFCILGPVTMHRLSRLMAMAVLIPVIVGYYGYFTSANPPHYEFSYEFPRYLGDRNSDTFMILTGLPFALAILLTGSYGRRWGVFGSIAFVLMAMAIFLSLSRANFLLMILVVFVMVMVNLVLKRTRRRSLVLVAIICTVLPLAVCLLPADRFFKTVTQYEQRFEQAHEDNRWDLALAVFELAGRHPLMGVGLQNFPVEFHTTEVGRFWYRAEKHKPVPHNSFLSVWVELGTPALIAFFMIVLWPLVSVLRLFPVIMRRQDPSLNALFLGSLGLGLVLIQGIAAYNFGEIFYFWIAYSFNALVVLALDRSLRQPTDRRLVVQRHAVLDPHRAGPQEESV